MNNLNQTVLPLWVRNRTNSLKATSANILSKDLNRKQEVETDKDRPS